jgi:hypothetical protein
MRQSRGVVARLVGVLLVGVAVFATMVASALAEGTGPKVTLRTASGVLKKGDPLVAFSSNLVVTTPGGSIECTKNTISGPMKTNTKEKPSGEITLAEATGELEGGRCKSTAPFGPAEVFTSNTPWKLKFINTGTIQINTGLGTKVVEFTAAYPAAGGTKCVYSIKKLLSSFPVSVSPVPLVITTTNQVFKLVAGSTAGCPTEGKMNGSFSTTSKGEAVEVETHT